MQPYRLSYERGSALKPREHAPPKPADRKWYGVRQFWAKSHDGEFIPAYEEGVTLAEQDLEAGVRTNREALKAVESEARDTAWSARRDGYLDTIGKRQGALEAHL